jgi:hypothetical protein
VSAATRWFVAAATLVVAGALSAAAMHGVPCGRAAAAGWAMSGVAWFAAWSTAPRPPDGARRWLAAAIPLSCLLLLASPPAFSDDLWRYLFDGALSRAGLHPFAYAPSSPKVADIAPWIATRVNHPDMPTIYPPAAQLLFAVASWLRLDDVGWRVVCCLAVVAGSRWLGQLGGDDDVTGSQLTVLSHPLVVVSAAGLGALDAFALLCVAAFVVAVRRRSAAAVGVAVAMATAVKLLPALLGAALLPSWRVRHWVAAAAVSAVVLGISYAPLLAIGTKSIGSLPAYSTRWEFNGGPAHWTTIAIERGLAGVGIEQAVELPVLTRIREQRGLTRVVDGIATSKAFAAPDELARAITTAIGLVCLAGTLVWAVRRRSGVIETAVWLLLALFAWSHTLYPWYLLWLLPLALLARHRFAVAWASAIPLSLWTHGARIDGLAWAEPWWVTPLIWLLAALLTAWSLKSAGAPDAPKRQPV